MNLSKEVDLLRILFKESIFVNFQLLKSAFLQYLYPLVEIFKFGKLFLIFFILSELQK